MTIKIDHAIIVLVGARGVGKSTLAATFLPPSRIGEVYYHDSEHSANNLRAQLRERKLDFGHYVDLADRFKDIDGDDLLKRISAGHLPWVDKEAQSNLIGYYKFVLDDLDRNMTKGKYKVYVLDTLETFEAGMVAWVEANKKASGVTITAYGKLYTDGVFVLYQNFLSALFARGIEVVILTGHLRSVWEGTRQVVGKVEPSGKKILARLATLYVWMVNDRSNADGSPAALVLKERLGMLGVSASGDSWELSRRLPERLPRATWADVNNYLANGCDLANPPANERMSESERAMISELVSDAQMQLMILDAQREASESSILPPTQATFSLPTSEPVNGNDNMEIDAQRETANRLINVGRSKADIATELGITLPQVIRLLKPE